MHRLQSIVAVLAIAAGVVAPAPQERRRDFDVRYLIPHGRRIDTQFYDFTGDGLKDALVVSIDMDADPPERWLALHQGSKGGLISEKPDQIWSVHPTTCALALGNVVPEGGTDVLEIAPDGVSYHAFDKGAMNEDPRKLLHLRTFFTTPSNRTLPTWAGAVDLNNDKLDDLVLPVPDGYKVYFQTKPGAFGTVVKLEADLVAPKSPAVSPTRFAADWVRLVGRGMAATSGLFNLHDELPRVTPVDLDGDGLKELTSLNGSLMTMFFQKPGMKFLAKDRKQYRINVLEGSDVKDAVSVTDVQFADIDADGNTDLIVTKIEGQLGLLDSIKTRIYYHLGTGRGNFNMADAQIFIDGISLNPMFVDMDGDGGLDVLTTRLRTDIISKGLERAIFGDITITYEWFQFDKKARTFSREPVDRKNVQIRDEDISKKGAASRPLFQVPGDLDGDKRADAVYFNPKESRLEVLKGKVIYAAGGTPRIGFSMDASATYAIDKDNAPKWISYFDIDGDGRLDILLNYFSQVIILLSRF
jgi:hypothetical protein